MFPFHPICKSHPLYSKSCLSSAQDFPLWYLGVSFLLLRFVSSAQLRDKPVLNPDTLVTLATKQQKNVATRDSRLRFWLHRARDRECDNNDDRVTSICCFQLVVSFCFCICFFVLFLVCLPVFAAALGIALARRLETCDRNRIHFAAHAGIY